MRRGYAWAVWMFTVGCWSGCAITSGQRADTLGAGKVQVGIEPTLNIVASGRGPPPTPGLDVSVRYGVGEGFDLGARLGAAFGDLRAEVQAKGLFTRPGDSKLAVSFAPTVGVSVGVSNPILFATLPLLVGLKGPVKTGPRQQMLAGNELVLGARVNLYTGAFQSFAVAPSLSVGYAIQLTDFLGIIPELSVGVSAFDSNLQPLFPPGTVFVQLKAGLLLGGARLPSARAP